MNDIISYYNKNEFKFKYILQMLWETEISSSYCQPEDSVVLWIEDGISSECFSYISRKKEHYKKRMQKLIHDIRFSLFLGLIGTILMM